MIFAVQRFGTSEGCAVPISPMQQDVAKSLGWASGEIPFLSPTDRTPTRAQDSAAPREANRRQLGTDSSRPAELVALQNVLIACAIALAVATVIQLLVIHLWRNWVNRRYYQERRREQVAAAVDSGRASAQQIDIDNDGRLSYIEFCAMVRQREGKEHTDTALMARFKALDVDGSGFIDMNEYVRSTLCDALLSSSATLFELFEEWDEDGLGTIDKIEFRRAIHSLELGVDFTIADHDIDALFDEFDEDQSGSMVYQELHTALLQMQEQRKQALMRNRGRRRGQADANLVAQAARIHSPGYAHAPACRQDRATPVGLADPSVAALAAKLHREKQGRLQRIRSLWRPTGGNKPSKQRPPAKFFAFPKSLVWPSPVIFTLSIFVTGLTRTSSHLLASDPPGCDWACRALAIAVMSALVAFIALLCASVVLFRRQHKTTVRWQPTAKVGKPDDVNDPYMRLFAKLRIYSLSRGLELRDRQASLGRAVTRRLSLGRGCKHNNRPRRSCPALFGVTPAQVQPVRIQVQPDNASAGGGCCVLGSSSHSCPPAPSPSRTQSQHSPPPSPPGALEMREDMPLARVKPPKLAHVDVLAAPPPSKAPPPPPLYCRSAVHFSVTEAELPKKPSRPPPPPPTSLKPLAQAVLLSKILAKEKGFHVRVSANAPAENGMGCSKDATSIDSASLSRDTPPDNEIGRSQGVSRHEHGATLDDKMGYRQSVSCQETGKTRRTRRQEARNCRHQSRAEIRTSAVAMLESRGYRDRRTGGFPVPDADLEEPARTERLLASPFALWHSTVGDKLHAFEGFLLFRVNGSSCFGMYFRPLVVVLNFVFGLLSGMYAILPEGSLLAYSQAIAMMLLQFGMGFVSCFYLPDADRIISRFAGLQFFFEGAATTVLLGASLFARASEGKASEDIPEKPPHGPSSSNRSFSSSTGAPSLIGQMEIRMLLVVAFVLSLVALSVPITQLLEQRAITPFINIMLKRGCSPRALLAAAYILAVSLPKRIMKLIATGENGPEPEEKVGISASAGAAHEEEDAEVEETTEREGRADDGARRTSSDPEVTVHTCVTAGARAGGLMARAMAAKEVMGRRMAANTASTPSAPQRLQTQTHLVKARANVVMRLLHQRTSRKMRPDNDIAVEDFDDNDD